MKPTKLDEWTTLKNLGRGGNGEVQLVERKDGESGKCSLKKVLGVHVENMEKGNRIRRELSILQKLNNVPHTPRLVSWVEEPFCIIYEFIEGKDLSKYVQAAPLSVLDSCRVVRRIVAILKDVHAAGIVHRDIKPTNIIYKGEKKIEELFLIDFGMAYFQNEEDQNATLTGDGAVGNRFMSLPEYYIAEQKRDKRSDLTVALGILYYLATRKYPSNLLNESEILYLIKIEQSNMKMKEIMIKGMKMDLADRYQTAEELLADLDELISTLALNDGVDWFQKLSLKNTPTPTKSAPEPQQHYFTYFKDIVKADSDPRVKFFPKEKMRTTTDLTYSLEYQIPKRKKTTVVFRFTHDSCECVHTRDLFSFSPVQDHAKYKEWIYQQCAKVYTMN